MNESQQTEPGRPAVVAVLHPGEMGAAVGQCLRQAGHEVLWVSPGRGPQTAARAQAAGLTEVATTAEAIARADVIFSVCPPHAAADVARSARGFSGRYVDANAISPTTARAVASIVTQGGATYVDGGIIGGPPTESGTTRLYLSGAAAPAVSALFDGTPLEARVVAADQQGPAGPFAASAVKMAYAAWTKGSGALLLAARALAEAEGVSGALLEEWALSQPALAGRLTGAAVSASRKGWRWVGEMEEIAATMATAGLPDGFHLAAAEVFRRSPPAPPDATAEAIAAEVITALPNRG